MTRHGRARHGRTLSVGAVAALAVALWLPAPAGATLIEVTDTADDLLSAADDGDCALREAVAATSGNTPVDQCAAGEAAPAEDTIQLAGGTYTLTGGPEDDANLSGDLDVNTADGSGPLTIQGGADRTTIDGSGIDRVFDLAGSATLDSLTITNGSSPTFGGGITTRGDAVLTLVDSDVIGNGAGDGPGGGLYLSGNATLTNSRVLHNVSSGAGGGIYNSGATLSSNRSLVEGNHATLGGGIANEGSGTLDLNASVVFDNAAQAAAGEPAAGAGILNTGTATIDGSVISANNAQGSIGSPATGAGIENLQGASLTITDSTIARNVMFVAGSRGAGINNDGGSSIVNVRNSTISGNLALGGGAGGGGINSFGGEVSLNHVTLAGNRSDQGEAISSLGASALALRASVIDNTDAACQGEIASGGFNVDAGASCASAANSTDLPNAATGLDLDLADNAGPQAGPPGSSEVPQTHELADTSPAVDRVPAAQCFDVGTTPLTSDQRGSPRPEGSVGCDSGAYEVFVPVELANVEGTPPATAAPSQGPACAALRAKLKKTKSKKKKRKIRAKLKRVGC